MIEEVKKDFLDTRDSNWAKVHYSFFSSCNNSCEFCIQKYLPKFFNNAADPDKLRSQFSILETWIRINSKKYKEIRIFILGGEIFYLPYNEYFSIYKFIFDKLRVLQDELNIIINVALTTSLIYKCTNLCEASINYLLKYNLLREVEVSFDIIGRFASQVDVDTFYNNSIWLKKFINDNVYYNVAGVISRPAINEFIDNNSTNSVVKYAKECFNYIYNEKVASIEWGNMFLGTSDSEYLNKWVPNATEIYNFWQYMTKMYPNEKVSTKFLNLKKKEGYWCNGQCFMCWNGKIDSLCSYGFDKDVLVKLKLPIENRLERSIILKKIFESYKCLQCEHFKRCDIHDCLWRWDLSIFENWTKCWKKDLYNK